MKNKLVIIIISICMLFLTSRCGDNTNLDEDRVIMNMEKPIKKSEFQHDFGAIYRLWCSDSLIYVPNDPENYIYTYNFNGVMVKRIGTTGPAPWENSSIWYFNKDTDSTYWVHDFEKQLIRRHNYYNDSLIVSRRVISFFNIVYVGMDKFIIPRYNESSERFVFSVFDFYRNVYIEDLDFQSAYSRKCKLKRNGASLFFEGCFTNYKNKRVVYISYNIGAFLVLDLSNSKITEIKDFREFEWPSAEYKNEQLFLNPNITISLSACIDSNNLYVLTSNNKKRVRRRYKRNYVDIYNLTTYKYVKSLFIDKSKTGAQAERIWVEANNLVVHYQDDAIAIYDISGLFNNDSLR